MGNPAEKEYYITEWTSDHARSNWWKESEILEEHGISRGSKNKDDWHCSIEQERIFANKYDEDWNLLMDVYAKLNTLPYLGEIGSDNCEGYGMHTYIKVCIPDKKRTHFALVEYIKWYAGEDPTILAQV